MKFAFFSFKKQKKKNTRKIHPSKKIHQQNETNPKRYPDTLSNKKYRDIIPEESYHHGYSKSLCEPQGEEWDAMLADAERTNHASTNSEKLLRSGREPLLPKLTPRAQIRRGMAASAAAAAAAAAASSASGSNKRSHVTTALLSTSNSDYDDDNDEDFDLYDDENIVVTTTTIPHDPSGSGRPRSGSDDGEASAATTSTTTIRLTRNNDESII